MDYRTENLILHFVTEDDLTEVARTWPSDHRPISEKAAEGMIENMRQNYGKNAKGRICHLCLAVCLADDPHTIMGWCGLDGSRDPVEPEIFILLDEEYRNQGYGTQCVRKLLQIATEDYALPGDQRRRTRRNEQLLADGWEEMAYTGTFGETTYRYRKHVDKDIRKR